MKIGPRKGSDGIWFNMIVKSGYQRQGVGSRLLILAKEKVKDLHGWVIMDDKHKKINGDYYNSPIKFYKKNGFRLTGITSNYIENVTLFEIHWKAKN